MKSRSKSPSSKITKRAAATVVCTSAFMTSQLMAQSPAMPLPGLGGQVANPGAVAVIQEESSETSSASRYVSAESVSEYVTKYAEIFDIRSRKADPFGQAQDPTAKPTMVKPTITNRRPTNFGPTAFSDIIERIQVNTIRPADKMFLIGTRPFKLGDNFPLSYRGKKIDVKIVGVSARQIDFENVDTGEVASVKLRVLPPGMSSGNYGVNAPGMVTDDSAAPLTVDPINPN